MTKAERFVALASPADIRALRRRIFPAPESRAVAQFVVFGAAIFCVALYGWGAQEGRLDAEVTTLLAFAALALVWLVAVVLWMAVQSRYVSPRAVPVEVIQGRVVAVAAPDGVDGAAKERAGWIDVEVTAAHRVLHHSLLREEHVAGFIQRLTCEAATPAAGGAARYLLAVDGRYVGELDDYLD